MQYHLNGYRPGDPAIAEPAETYSPEKTGILPAETDILIVGCGPAGLTLAAQLSAFDDIRTTIVEQKQGRLMVGQADGIACRTVEMFEAFGFAEKVLKEAYWVNETVFWRPDSDTPENIVRGDRIQDTEDGLSEFPHVILNQARVHDFYLDVMENAPSRLVPVYDHKLVDLKTDPDADLPVKAVFEQTDKDGNTQQHTVSARYIVGCDGARSSVRKLLGEALVGDSANKAWGVMDVLAVTDFPDIRLKTVIRSSKEGSILIIPREGGYMVRFYIELDKLNKDERVSHRNITADDLIAAAQRILHPYSLDVKEVAWWSVYEIGQRLCERFDNRSETGSDEFQASAFIAGDACHTHSPKAGQGMNVSMGDAFNLGWKLAAVLRGQAGSELLATYSAERQTVAQELIDFDREFARMFATQDDGSNKTSGGTVDPGKFQEYFVKHGRFTAGTAIRYYPSLITQAAGHQELATGFPVGMRFHSAPAICLGDAKPVHLGHQVKADGRWRIFVFADRASPQEPQSRLAKLCSFLAESAQSPVLKYTPKETDIDSVIDVRAVFQQPHRELAIGAMPTFLLPRKGKYELVDYEKMFCPDPVRGDVFSMRGISRDEGCIVVVRPDQYVASILPLDSHDALTGFFDRFMLLPE